MPREVDDRIVKMSFDNKAFEKGAAESMSSLQKLNGLVERFGKSGSSGDISELSKAMSTVKENTSALADRFTTLGGQIKYAFQTSIINDFVEALKAPLKQMEQLTSAQVSAGWEKYANKTSAVQSIMSATAQDFEDVGEQMAYVNAQVDKLNWFTDETSFNLVDMTQNVGKFTSQGIALDESATAMIGIAVAAGKAGATASDASRAMYNLSQSLGAGSVKLQDWMSIENANMATKEFKETLLEGAVAAGTLTKDAEGLYHYLRETKNGVEDNIVSAANFREFLADGIISSEALMNGLKEYGRFTEELKQLSDEADLSATEILEDMEAYADGTLNMTEAADRYAMSVEDLTDWMDELNSEQNALGRSAFKASQEAKTYEEAIGATADAISTSWMNIFQLIFGDYEKAKEVWTDFAGFLWDVFAQPVDILYRAIRKYNDGITGIGANVRNVLYSIGEVGRVLLQPLGEALEIFTYTDLYANGAITGFSDAETAIGSGLQKFTKRLSDAATGASAFMQTVSELREAMSYDGEESYIDKLEQFIGYIEAYRSGGTPALAEIGLTDAMVERVQNLSRLFKGLVPEEMTERLEMAVRMFDNLRDGIEGIFSGVRIVSTVVGKFLSETWSALAPGRKGLLTLLDNLLEAFGSGGRLITQMFMDLKASGDTLFPRWSSFISSVSEGVRGIYDEAAPIISDIFALIQTGSNWIISKALPLLSSMVGGLFEKISYFFSSEQGWNPLYSIREMIGFFKDSMNDADFSLLDKIKNPFDSEKFKSFDEVFSGDSISTFISNIRTSVSESERFQNVWSRISSFSLKDFFGGIVDWVKQIDFAGLAQSVGDFIDSLEIPEGTRNAINNAKEGIAGFVEHIKELAKDMTAGDWVAVIKKLPKIFTSIGVALGAIKTGGGIANFGKGMKGIGDGVGDVADKLPKWEEFTKFFSGFTKDIKKMTKQISGNTFDKSFKRFAEGILMIAAALALLAIIDTESLIASGLVLGGVITGLTIAINSFADNTLTQSASIEAGSKAMVKMATSLLLVGIAIRMLARVKPEALALGFTAIAAMLGVMTISLKALNGADSKKAAEGMLIMAFAIDTLSIAVIALGMVPLLILAKGLGAVAIMLSTMSKSLQKLNGNDALKAAGGMMMIALAIDMLVPGLTILGLLPLAVLGKGLAAIGVLLAEMTIALKALNGADVLEGAAAIDLIAAAFIVLVPALILIGTMDISTLIQGLAGIAAVFVIMGVAGAVLGPMATNIAILAGSLQALGIGVLAAGAGMYLFVAALAAFVALGPAAVAAITAVVLGIIDLFPAIAVAIVNGIVSFAAAILDNVSVLVDAVITLITEIAVSMAESAPLIIEAALTLIEALLKSIAAHLPQILQSGWDIVKTLVSGIGKAVWSLIPQSGRDAIIAAKDAMKEKISDFFTLGRDIISGLIEGVDKHVQNLVNYLADLGRNCVGIVKRILRINSPSKEFAFIGEMMDAGLVKGLKDEAKSVNNAAANVGEGALLSITDIASRANDILDESINPTITPVLDLSDVERGASDLQSLLNTDRSMSIAGSINPMNRFEDEGPLTTTAMSGLVSRLESAISKIQNGDQNASFDFYLDGAKLEAAVTRRQRNRAVAVGR